LWIFSFSFSISRSANWRSESRNGLVCFLSLLCFILLASHISAQEVTVLMSNGDRVTGSLLEYSDETLKLKTQSGTLKISHEDLVIIDFTVDRARISAQAYLHLINGKELLNMGMEEEALEKFKAAILESPRYADAHYEVGALLEKRGQQLEAMGYIKRAISLDSGKSGMAAQFMEVADGYFDAGELEAAADTYYQLFQNFPDDPMAEDAVYRSGFIFATDLENNRKAIAALEGAIATFPDSKYIERGFYELGRIYEEEGAVEASESLLNQLIINYPSSQWVEPAHYALARVYHRKRQNGNAVDELVTVIRESSDPTLISSAERMLDQCIWTVYDISDGLPDDDVRAIVKDGYHLWIGTASGIVQFDLKTNTISQQILLPETDVWALAVDANCLWVGTLNSGIKQYNKLDGTWLTYTKKEGLSSDRTFAISIDNNNVWFGTTLGGVYSYNKFDNSWTNYTTRDGLSSNNIVSIASAPSGTWCGTLKNGACYFDSIAGSWKTINDPSMSGEKFVTSISAGANYVWFAWKESLRNGFSRYNATAKSWEDKGWGVFAEWEKNTPSTRGTNSNIINLGANNKETWIAADAGVLAYDHSTSGWSKSYNYPSEISGQVPISILVEDDSVWFATSHGLVRLDKNMISRVEQANMKTNE